MDKDTSELESRLAKDLSDFATKNNISVDAASNLAWKLIAKSKLVSRKGSFGILSSGLFVDLRKGHREILDDQHTVVWSSTADESVSELVFISGGRVMQRTDRWNQNEGPREVVVFTRDKIYSFDLETAVGGFYERL